MIQPPGIQIDPGTEIGYSCPLARFDSAVTLSAGTHFLLARNGRGKTTLLRTLAGTLKPISGRFSRHGTVQYLPEDLRFDAELSPATIFRALLPSSALPGALKLADAIELDVRKPCGRLSTGNRRKTNLIMAEFSIRPEQPSILLLDEPFSGLDAFAREAFESMWKTSSSHVLRLVSCHPDYDSMRIPSAILIESGSAHHVGDSSQTWDELKKHLN